MNTRIKLNRPDIAVPASRSAAEAVVRKIVELKLEEQALKTEMDERITAIKKDYEARLGQIEAAMQPQVEAVHAWAEAHPEEFQGKKSLEMLHGIIGWRITPPALKPLRGFTWATVLNRLRDLGRFDFIRTKEEVNKEALLAARDTENLKAFYCQVIQEDEFFIEPKLTPVEPRETTA